MRYKLLEWASIKNKTDVYISKEQVIKMFQDITKDKMISGFFYNLEKRGV